VTVYAIDSTTGALSAVDQHSDAGVDAGLSYFIGIGNWTIPAISPNQDFFYCAAASAGKGIVGWQIDRTNGLLEYVGGPSSLTQASRDVAFAPDGGQAFIVARSTISDLYSFTANSSTGALATQAASLMVFPDPEQVEVDPQGSFVYVTDSNYFDVFRIESDGGPPTEIAYPLDAGGPFVSAGAVVYRLVAHPTKPMLLASTGSPDALRAYAIDAGTGAPVLAASKTTTGHGALALRPR
jgi:DNA-binding beta-propeller fold protein YncE